jgi:hypothetical protein
MVAGAALLILLGCVLLFGFDYGGWGGSGGRTFTYVRGATTTEITVPSVPPLDTHAYDVKMLKIAHLDESNPWYSAYLAGTTTPLTADGHATTTKIKKPDWPVRAAYPKSGALLPFNRIVAYYGNFYSTGMGVLGQYPEQVMLQKLASTTALWREADPSTPVIPAIHYIVETAQASPTKSGLYVARMPDDQIDKALAIAAKIHGVVFIDFQVGLSTIQKELPMYEKYLAMPNVHVGIDPEFSMKTGTPPGREIGTFDATDINWVANYLAGIVEKNNLPPKILIIHRFTQAMVTHATRITPLPEVQIVMDMDGWGSQAKKITTYVWIVAAEPVQFTGFKLFYKNDILPPSTGLMTPSQVLKLTPAPIYIQYQ